MSSINTNVAAMTALQSLTHTNNSLVEVQSRISTGLRVAEASDNAAYWSIATTMRSDNAALSTVQDALGLGAATVNVAYTGVKSAIDVVDQIKSKLVAAREPGVDRSKIQSDIDSLQDQLRSIADSASFSGQNWLKIDTTDGEDITKSVVSSFNRSTDGSVSIGTISITLYNATDDSTSALFDADSVAAADKKGILDTQSTTTNGGVDYTVANLDISALTDSADDLADLDEMISTVDAAVSTMTTAATSLGSAKSRIDIQKTFVSNLMDAIKTGIGALVDADMNEESTKLQALQVQQQLGVQALSIANSSSQAILRLFQ
ncbi:MAG TPA: flagellin [Ilumatobacteraceae bacterium]